MAKRYVGDVVSRECWAHCQKCDVDFRLGVSVPCPLSVYVAGLKAARCPQCGTHKKIMAYSPGLSPKEARREKGYGFSL